MLGWVFLASTSTKQGLMCLAQGHNAATPVRLKPAIPRSQDKCSTTEPLCSQNIIDLHRNTVYPNQSLSADEDPLGYQSINT